MDTGKMGMNLLKNSSFILVLSILFGFIWPGPASSSEILVTPVLMLMMTFSWIALARTLGIGAAIYAAALLSGQDRSHAISYTLLGSYKNLGLAAAVSLTLFGPEAGIPAAFSALAETGFFILLAIAKPR